jgi:beta-lactamase regulating signal transducer with metallopeptidase domain
MTPETAHFLGALFSVAIVRGTLVFCAAWAVTSLAKRLSAEVLHLLWMGVIAGFVLIPLAWLALPSLPVDLGIPRGSAADWRLLAAPALSRAEYARVIERTSVEAILTLRNSSLAGWIPTALIAVWSTGLLALAARLLVGTVRLRRLAGRGSSNGGLQSFSERIARELGIRRRFRVVLSPMCRIPFSIGAFNPVIMLPVDADSWPGSRLRQVLTHELAHVGRWDVLLHSMAYAVCVLFWFAPPLWLAYSRLLREAETCCDQMVIDRGTRGSEYARSILELARSADGRMILPCTSVALGRAGMLKDRIKRILTLRQGLRPFEPVRVLALCLCCLVPVLAVFGQAESPAIPKSDPLFGTWKNVAYDASRLDSCAKWSITADGHEYDYRRFNDTNPVSERWHTIEKAWVDAAGAHQYRSKIITWIYPGRAGKCEGFLLVRISPDGNTFESVFAQYGYPDEVTRLGPCYAIGSRQR